MKTQINIQKLLAIIFIVAGTACEDVLEQETPHIITADNLYTSIEGFEAGLYGLYNNVRRERGGTAGSNHLMIVLALSGTDVQYGNRPVRNGRPMNEWGDRVTSTEAYFNDVWEWLYETINAANTLINRADNPEVDIPAEELNLLVAEARTIRAWAYRHLAYLYGDVPLVLNEAVGEEVRTDWERTPVAEVWAQVKADLEFGVAHLPEDFINDGRIIKAVAQHYLAELLIMEGNFTEAIAMAQAAIDGPRSLVTERYGVASGQPGTPYTDMFLEGNVNPSEGNTEALWVLQYELNVIGGEGDNIMRRWMMSEYSSTNGGAPGLAVTVERGGRGLSRMSATHFMLNLYDEDSDGNILDDRGSYHAWRRFFTYIEEDPIPAGKSVGDTIFLDFTKIDPTDDRFVPFTRKWDYAFEVDPRTTRSYKEQAYLRLADTYLLLAEAQLMNSDPDASAATINVLRDRANAPNITGTDVDLDFILDERARELFSEEHRRYTLLRTNKWLERTRAYNTVAGPNIEDRNVLYPIPQDFLDANTDLKLDNNTGY